MRRDHTSLTDAVDASIAQQYAGGEPARAANLPACQRNGPCPVRLELLSVVDMLREALTQAISSHQAPGRPVMNTCTLEVQEKR